MDGLGRLFQEWQRLEQWARYAHRPDPRQLLAGEVEREAARRLLDMGYAVQATTGNARYDLLVDYAARVEVKASEFYPAAGDRGGRYQAHFHNRADLLFFGCQNGSIHFFIIPTADLDGRRNVAIWSYNPGEYLGQWRRYYEAWELVAGVVETAKGQGAHQLPLFGEVPR